MRISFHASQAPAAQSDLLTLAAHYGNAPADGADVIVALGGDGFMLELLHTLGAESPPVFGINRGTVGFLMNRAQDTDREMDLHARLCAAVPQNIHPLHAHITTARGHVHSLLAINDVSLLRQGPQAANLRVSVNGTQRIENLMCDGVLVATPAGSTAYNFSANGPILPIGANVLALTPLAAFRPRRWRGAVIPDSAEITIETLDPHKRPVLASADSLSINDAARVHIRLANECQFSLLFDADHDLERRILDEQFL